MKRLISAVLIASMVGDGLGCMAGAPAQEEEASVQAEPEPTAGGEEGVGEAQQKFDPITIGLLIVGAIAAGFGAAATLGSHGHPARPPGAQDPFWPDGHGFTPPPPQPPPEAPWVPL